MLGTSSPLARGFCVYLSTTSWYGTFADHPSIMVNGDCAGGSVPLVGSCHFGCLLRACNSSGGQGPSPAAVGYSLPVYCALVAIRLVCNVRMLHAGEASIVCGHPATELVGLCVQSLAHHAAAGPQWSISSTVHIPPCTFDSAESCCLASRCFFCHCSRSCARP